MADYTNSKSGIGAVFPERAVDTALQRLEPLLGPEEFKSRHLFGISLVSQMKDPITGKNQLMNDEQLRDYIEGAVNQVEIETGIDIFPTQRKEKHPYDRALYEAYGYMQLNHRPTSSIEALTVNGATQQDLYSIPLEWIETAYLPRGQINIVPMTGAFIYGGTIPTTAIGGAFFMSLFGNSTWIPSFWQVTYTSGYKDGMVPRIVNDLVGTVAAMEVLSMLGTTYARTQGHSLGIDGLSQSVSSLGPNLFQTRLAELQAKRDKLVAKIKALYDLKFSINTY